MTQPNADTINFYDNHPEPIDFCTEVLNGLSAKPKQISPKFFYDETGSRLFEAICETPEYYPTRTEVAILERNIDEVAHLIGPNCLLVEPGAGSSQKVRILLDSIKPDAYVPIDISKDFLRQAALDLAAQYPWLDIHATCGDFTQPMELPYCPPSVNKVAFFPGSSIGNFEPRKAVAFLSNIARMVKPNGGMLIGVDLKKHPDILNAAYNDKQGVTADFNRNLLTRINQELDGHFDVEAFYHHAFYNEEFGRVEMHLVSLDDQTVRVNQRSFEFDQGESIHTESSYKYSIAEFQALARQSGFHPVAVWTDPDGLFSVHYLAVD